ncbi:MAG: hypothetical protein DMD30_13350 [Gemmatimonadetes bacterium]|nr:MAG: hypothetical protein DMD30_13350 [Gemmatimonadota bacterium]PYP50806.1 MAG: hypothetical protein DMD39_09775 [Gemmatimonadota bacterium]
MQGNRRRHSICIPPRSWSHHAATQLDRRASHHCRHRHCRDARNTVYQEPKRGRGRPSKSHFAGTWLGAADCRRRSNRDWRRAGLRGTKALGLRCC